MRSRLLPWLMLAVGVALFVAAVAALKRMPLRLISLEMTTALPRFVQVVLAGGDRYLAANVDVFRALTVSGKTSAVKLHVQGQIHADAAWLNPAHEDNYYVAAAMLPWDGEFDAADAVLAAATTARPFDAYPPFFRGFNHYYFRHDRLTGARYLRVAAERADSEQNRQAFETIAARWTEKGAQPDEAVRILAGMKETSRSAAVKVYLQQRIEHLQNLLALRAAADRYRERFHAPLGRLDDLVRSGLIPRIPQSLPDQVFVLDGDGVPISVNRPPNSEKKP